MQAHSMQLVHPLLCISQKFLTRHGSVISNDWILRGKMHPRLTCTWVKTRAVRRCVFSFCTSSAFEFVFCIIYDNSACFSAVPNDPLVPTAVLGEDWMCRVCDRITGVFNSVQPVLWLKDNMKSNRPRLLALVLLCTIIYNKLVHTKIFLNPFHLSNYLFDQWGVSGDINQQCHWPIKSQWTKSNPALHKHSFMLSLICPYFQIVKYFESWGKVWSEENWTELSTPAAHKDLHYPACITHVAPHHDPVVLHRTGFLNHFHGQRCTWLSLWTNKSKQMSLKHPKSAAL